MARLSTFLIFLLLFSLSYSLAFPISSKINFRIFFNITGDGSGHVDIVEYPLTVPGQRAECTSPSFDFPPYTYLFSCNITRFYESDRNYEVYAGGDLVEFDSEMAELAERLKGRSDMDTALNIAEWIRKNVRYDLGLGDEEKSAVWTFYHRSGTCDEIARLFIALARAAGLNARYVSGYAFGSRGWLPHAWAEVWTSLGWFAIDIPFQEYGTVDAFHIVTHRGTGSSHDFIKYRYFGRGIDVEYNTSISVRDSANLTLSPEIEVFDTFSGGDLLVKISAVNPLSTPVGFPVYFSFPENFKLRKVYGRDFIIFYPGRSYSFFVFRVPEIPENTVYRVPMGVQFGDFFLRANFSVSGIKPSCPVPEPRGGVFFLKDCINLATGERENVTEGGDYYCGSCYFHIPVEPRVKVALPEFCYRPCNITLILEGLASVRVRVNNVSRVVDVKELEVVDFPVYGPNVTVAVGNASANFTIAWLPDPGLSYSFNGSRACFSSPTWKLERSCYPLRCGTNIIPVRASYGNFTAVFEERVEKKCGLIQLISEMFFNILSGIIG